METTQIYISSDLRRILEQIRDNSVIASLILQGVHLKRDLPENHINYLAISEADSSKISYLTHDKLLRLKKSGRNIWETAGRTYGRPGSVVGKLFNIEGREVEIFNNLYKAALSKAKFTFKIVNGEDIKKYYHADTYGGSGSGSLGNSCMKYDHCQKFFGLYSDNNEIISMLVMLDNRGLLMGRALLWNFDSNKIMDRIYTIYDEEFSYHFKKWAIENGYMYKHEQKWNTTLQFEIGGKKIEKKFSVKLPHWDYDKYPYLDTFKFFDRKSGTLYNYIPYHIESRNIRTLCAPDGNTLDGNIYCLDFLTNIYQHLGETVAIKYFDGKMTADEYRTHSTNVEWSNVNELHILKKDVIFDERIDDFIFCPELSNLNNQKKIEERIAYLEERNKARKAEKALVDDLLLKSGSFEAVMGRISNRSRRQNPFDISTTITTTQSNDNDVVPNEHPVSRQPLPDYFWASYSYPADYVLGEEEQAVQDLSLQQEVRPESTTTDPDLIPF